MMKARRLSSWALLLLVGLSGCGGSGSSGFEVTAEDQVISQALEEQHCINRGGIWICPAGVGPELLGPISPPTIFIDAKTDPRGVIPCTSQGSPGSCSFTVAIESRELPAGAELRVALRTGAPPGPWWIGPPLALTAGPEGPGASVPVTVELAGDAALGRVRVQLAVLVFLEPPPALPPKVTELAASRADFAFVTAPLPLESFH